MKNATPEKESFRRFLIFFCSWNFLLDIGSLALIFWFASFYENSVHMAENYLLIFLMLAFSITRTVYYFILLIIKAVKKEWKQFFWLLAGFFIQVIFLVCFLSLTIYVLSLATLAIGPLH